EGAAAVELLAAFLAHIPPPSKGGRGGGGSWWTQPDACGVSPADLARQHRASLQQLHAAHGRPW
ncbi:unnamed protein product, partial [Heterosigma akashiwo]